MSASTIRGEIERITADLIGVGLCVDQNFPVLKIETGKIFSVSFSGLVDLSVTLKNVPYKETYERLIEARSYNIKLIDGGLIQLLYRFVEDELRSHRLAFFPSPDLLLYQNDSEIYEDDVLYGDVTFRNIITVPVRFDFDPAAFVEIDHPKSHLTLGQYKNCRIAVSGPASPYEFVSFILKSFYNTPFRNFCGDLRSTTHFFEKTISTAELRSLHVHLGQHT